MQRVFSALFLIVLMPFAAIAEVRAVHTLEPRAFGYFLGDTLERTVEIETGPDDEIVPASLPRTGPSNYWLELRAIAQTSEQRGDGRLHTLKLTYQTFYAPIDPRKQTIPQIELTIRGPAGNQTTIVPEFTFLMSPLREIFPEKSGETAETFLRPDIKPELRRSAGLRSGVLALAGLSGLLLLLVARDLGWWPFHKRPVRPFSRAVREVGRALGQGGTTGYKAALLAMHRAFDTAAGQRLLAADLDGFLTSHPEHGETRPLVERFFAASRAAFFGDAPRQAETGMPATELKELASVLARQERGAR
jgi:mxaA protein